LESLEQYGRRNCLYSYMELLNGQMNWQRIRMP
jgi:hypothetical protein